MCYECDDKLKNLLLLKYKNKYDLDSLTKKLDNVFTQLEI